MVLTLLAHIGNLSATQVRFHPQLVPDKRRDVSENGTSPAMRKDMRAKEHRDFSRKERGEITPFLLGRMPGTILGKGRGKKFTKHFHIFFSKVRVRILAYTICLLRQKATDASDLIGENLSE